MREDLAASVPLVVSALSLGTSVTFPDRVAAAATAGFAGIGLRAEDYWAAREEGLDDHALRGILDTHQVAVREVELLHDWASGAPTPAHDARPADRRPGEKEEIIFHIARVFGVSHVNAGLIREVPGVDLPAALAALCERAGDLDVAVEPLAFGPLPTIAHAWRAAHDSGAPNVGVLVDLWHWRRSATTPDDLATVPADRVLAVQLADVAGTPHTDLRAEALHHRLPPGLGHGDVPALLRLLREHGVTPRVVSVEVMNDELIAQGPRTCAQVLAACARDVLVAA